MDSLINPNNVVNFDIIKNYKFESWEGREIKFKTKGLQILFFISLHCLHCIDFLPDIAGIEQEFQTIDFVLFSNGEVEDHKEMTDYFKWKLPIVHLNQEDFICLFNIKLLPYMLLLKDGVVELGGVVDNKADFLQFAGHFL